MPALIMIVTAGLIILLVRFGLLAGIDQVANAMRWTAKTRGQVTGFATSTPELVCLVAAGLADRAEVIVSYAIGIASPISVSVETFDTNHVPNETISKLVEKHFDLRPAAIIQDLKLRRPIYQQTAAYGHFGRDDLNLPWEQTDKAGVLRKEAGL